MYNLIIKNIITEIEKIKFSHYFLRTVINIVSFWCNHQGNRVPYRLLGGPSVFDCQILTLMRVYSLYPRNIDKVEPLVAILKVLK